MTGWNLTWYRRSRLGYRASIASAWVWAIAEALPLSDDANALFLLGNTGGRLSVFTLVVLLLTEKLADPRERHLALTDFLTGLCNRRACRDVLAINVPLPEWPLTQPPNAPAPRPQS